MTQPLTAIDRWLGNNKSINFPPAKPTGAKLKALRAKKKAERKAKKRK